MATQVKNKAKPIIPTVLQWNARGLRTRLPDLRQHLFLNPVDVLAIQEPLTQPGDFRLSPYVIYSSAPALANGRSRALLLVKAGLSHNHVDLSAFSSHSAEYVAATIRVRGVEFTVVSVYVAPGSTADWDARILRDIARQCPGRLLFCGDFNAHNTTWGDNRTTPRGSALEEVTTSLGLEALNDGSETFVRQGVHGSVLDLTFAPRDIAASWTVMADTWGSDHVPIMVVSPHTRTRKYKKYEVTHWDLFRQHLSKALEHGPMNDLGTAITNALSLSTRTVNLPIQRPAPDLEYLNLRAARRRAQRKARRTNIAADWQHHRKIDAKFRRHTTRLQRKQWNQLCASFASPGGLTKAWKIARALSAEKVPTHPTAGLAISLQLTLEATAELLADEFSRNIPSPAGYRPFTISPPDGPPPIYFDTDFTVDELKAALVQCTRRSAPGPDGVTYQALRNIDECHYPNLLQALNHVWQTSEIPDAWKLSHVIPIPKSGKPLTSPESYRPISLTSCVGKLLERLVLRRLTWHLDATKALPGQLSGFRRHRCTADAICDIVSALEEARATRQVMYCVFLDIRKAFDALPHDTILHQLSNFGISGRAYNYIRAFLQNRSFVVKVLNATSTPRHVTQGVPQGSVISPFLFNLAMASLPGVIPQTDNPLDPRVNISIYADDVAIWAVGTTDKAKLTGQTLQVALDKTVAEISRLGLTLSAQKSTLLFSHPTYARQTHHILIEGTEVTREKTHLYLGHLIDETGSWRPAVKRLLMQCRQLLGLLRKFRAHSQQGLPPNGLLTLYKGLIKSKFLYSLPLANIRGPQRDQLERFHRVALRLCLGLPSNSPNIPTLVEAREQPLFLKGEESSKRHLIRIHVALSTDYLLMNLHSRSSSHFGRIAAEFTNEIGDPGPRFPIRPPHSTEPPLNVQGSLPDVRARKDVHPVVARTAVAVALEEKYASSLEIYTDGSVNKSAGTATAAYVIPSIGKEYAVRINLETSSTTAEMVAILLALEYLRTTEWMTAAVILTDSRTALRNLANAGEGSLLAQETAHLATTLQERGWTLAFQWVPAHSGIVGNERADTLAKNAHALPSPTYHLRPFHEARLLIARNIRSRHPDPSTARGTPPIPVPDSRLTRADASLLHRLRTGSAFTRLALHRYGRAGRVDSPECTVCGDPEDITHILLICPEYDAARKVLFATVLKAGGRTATTTCLLFPTGSRRQAWSIFRAVLEFLHQTELAERL